MGSFTSGPLSPLVARVSLVTGCLLWFTMATSFLQGSPDVSFGRLLNKRRMVPLTYKMQPSSQSFRRPGRQFDNLPGRLLGRVGEFLHISDDTGIVPVDGTDDLFSNPAPTIKDVGFGKLESSVARA